MLFYFTGVPLNALKSIRRALKGKFKKMEKLTEDDQLVFFYHKCKCNTTFNSLAVHYDLPPAYLSQAFENVEQILFVHAEENIWFLSEEQNKLTMPESFQKNYPQCSGIIDCFEIKTEVPSRVDQAILAFSNYKKGFTIKVLVCTAPCGLIQFISQGFGGRATDGQITIQAGFLPFIKPPMQIMQDKGFISVEEDIIRHGGLVIMPPVRRQKRQLNPKQRNENLKVAIDRVHVERGIERLRRFKVMKFMSHHMYKHCNKLLVILSYTVNCFPPLIRDPNCTYDEKVEEEEELTNEEIEAIMKDFEEEFGVNDEVEGNDEIRNRANSL